MTDKHGPQLAFSDQLHAQKYRLEGECYREACNRIANALKDNDDHFHRFRDILLNMRFLPAGRIQAAMGAPKQVTAYNCFVNGTVADSFVDGAGSIMARAAETAQTMRMGGGVGTDFSTLRPRGDHIAGVDSVTDGPLAFLPIWDAVCKATSSAGNRRGALMGVLRVDHPDIEAYIRLKQTPGRLEGFNLSVGITDEFMECLETGEPFKLQFNGRVYKTINAAALWEAIMRSTWDWAEPGVLFIDTINKQNNLWYCEEIAATNPCGEQPLPPYGACLLGSFNLTKYIVVDEYGEYDFDTEQLECDIIHVVRAMDNVIDRTIYPLERQRQEALNKRRMGIGVMGLANAIEALGFSYGSGGFLFVQEEIMRTIRNCVYDASVDLAAEKGSFPLFDKEKYLQGAFIKTLPDHIQAKIDTYGIRNSHLLSVAPTGTISFCADYVSSGIEPVFSYGGQRRVIMPEGEITVDVSDYGLREFGVHGKLSADVTAQEHINVLSVASKYVDSAVSKTCNVSPDMKWEDFKNIYIQAWKNGCKGCTTFNPNGKRMGILLASEPPAKKESVEQACSIDPVTGRRECS